MGQIIHATGRTPGGTTKLIFEAPLNFRKQLEPLNGYFTMTLEMMENATNRHVYHFKKVVVGTFINQSRRAGQPLNEAEGVLFLMHEVAKIDPGRDLKELSTKELTYVINKSKEFMNEFFAGQNQNSKVF